ncbi:polysaccharide pyruvyl transferase family protein [Alcanivorax sp.]|uniref:polysaccharide pyruvyl transferase family protein n=1 Tax=Alcanivorax sp. TaxID=1872427 RepID=UPI0025BD034D|nr:polysaccharide pyruvyl transferase family protein [Alcanivorax sp.]
MKVYYYKSAKGNFGDDLNEWIWDELLPGCFDGNEDYLFCGIGTIINSVLMPKHKRWVVFSSGAGYGAPPESFGDDNWDILCVRGPLSARVLGLSDDKGVTDGAALLSLLPEFQPIPETERKGVVFIPHHKALQSGLWEEACRRSGVGFVNPEDDARTVIHRIRQSKLVLADAMHAAIIADAMRVPWVPVVSSDHINTFKWIDWTETINETYKPWILGSSSLRESVRNKSLRLYGDCYFMNESKPDVVMDEFYRMKVYKSRRWWPLYESLSRTVFYKFPDKILAFVERFFFAAVNERYISSAAERLAEAARFGGQLSDEDVFRHNVKKLNDLLVKVKSRSGKKE